MAVSSLISYQRAKAESLGLEAKGGLMERAERIVLLCLGLLFDVLLDPDPVGDAGAHVRSPRAAVREGVAPGGRRAGHAGPHRDAPRAPPEPPGRRALDRRHTRVPRRRS